MPTALVTNATDFAGPPAVDALLQASLTVVAHDRGFADPAIRDRFLRERSGVELLSEAEPEALIAAMGEAHPDFDILVSNDHFPALLKPIEETGPEEPGATLDAVFLRPFRLIRAAVPRFKARRHGRIVAVTSCRTNLPMPGGSVPDAARAAMNALVRSLSVELAPFGIPVNAVAPNFLYSEAYFPRAVFLDSEAGQSFVQQVVPAGRLGEPAEVGEVIRFLATNTASFLTGAVIDFAGGWPAAPLPPRP